MSKAFKMNGGGMEIEFSIGKNNNNKAMASWAARKHGKVNTQQHA